MASRPIGNAHEFVDSARSAAVRAHLKHLTGSAVFASSRRRAELLCYLVERALAGEADATSEYAIGLDVYQKPESFDPRTDSTIRSSRLRRALAEYYEGQGAGDPWRIAFPNRSYVPVVVQAAPAPTEPASNRVTEVAEVPRATRRAPWLWAAAIAAGVLTAGLVLCRRAALKLITSRELPWPESCI